MGPLKSCIPLNFLPGGWESHTHTGYKGNLQGRRTRPRRAPGPDAGVSFQRQVSSEHSGPMALQGINNPDKMEAKCGQYVLPGRETRKPGRREGEAKEMWVHFVLFYF